MTEAYQEAIANATSAQSQTEATEGHAEYQAMESFNAEYAAAYRQRLSQNGPSSDALVAYFDATVAAAAPYVQPLLDAGQQQLIALATSQQQYDVAIAKATQTLNDALADNDKAYATAVIPQLKSASDTIAQDGQTAMVAMDQAVQQAIDKLADDQKVEVDAVAAAKKEAADTVADDAKAATVAEDNVALASANQGEDDAAAVVPQVNSAAQQGMDDAIAAAMQFAATQGPKSDQPVNDGSYTVGFTSVDPMWNVWVKRYVTLPGNPNSGTWYYRSMSEVYANIGQQFPDAASQDAFWNGFFYAGSRNNPPTVSTGQSVYAGGDLESSAAAAWSAFGNRIALTATGAISGTASGAVTGGAVGGVTTLGGGAIPGAIAGAISGALAGAFYAAYSSDSYAGAAGGGAAAGGIAGAAAPIEAAAMTWVASRLGIGSILRNVAFCFPAGTPVSTESGLRPIETIRPGDRVWAFDHVSDTWKLKSVRQNFERDYQADMVHVTIGGETIQSTMLHPYWVCSGADLTDRPVRSHLEKPPENSKVQGRWVDASDLRVGDRMLLRDGREAFVESVRHVPAKTTVYNFSVNELRCYAVGESQVLVHNTNGAEGLPPTGNLPPLRPIHALDQSTLNYWKTKSTQEILESLKPGQPEALKAWTDGSILNGHHRLQILKERGIDINSLAREIRDKFAALGLPPGID